MTEEQLRKLERLNELKNNGGITEVEYEKEKREILGDESPIIIGADNKVIIPDSKSNRQSLLGCFFIIVIIGFISFLFRDKKVEENQSSEVAVKPESKAAEPENKPIIDSVQLKKDRLKAEANLKKHFSIKEDEFDKTTWCTPKAVAKHRNDSRIYCYFEKKGDEVRNFRFAGQYYSDSFLYIHMAQFLVDGNTLPIGLHEMERDSVGARRLEWFDEGMNDNTRPLVEAIAKAKTVKIKYIGRKYSSVKIVSETDIESIKIALETYKGLGGEMQHSLFKTK